MLVKMKKPNIQQNIFNIHLVTLAKEHPIMAFFAILGGVWVCISIINYLVFSLPKNIREWQEYQTNKIYLDKIYLVMPHTKNWILPLGFQGEPVFTPYEIKPGVSQRIQFSLIQNNKNAPPIKTIQIKFPDTAEVKPLPDVDGRTWQPSNTEHWYFIHYSSDNPFTSGQTWDLPMFDVTFKDTKFMPFEYKIFINKMDNIERKFSLTSGTDYKYTESAIWCNFPRSCKGMGEDAEGRLPIYDISKGLLRGYYQPSVSASGSTVSLNVTPIKDLVGYPVNRVSPDSGVIMTRTCPQTKAAESFIVRVPEQETSKR